MLETLKKLQQDFELIESERDRYEFLIEIGKELPIFPERLKTDENRVPGCISGVFVHVEKHDNKIRVQGISHSLIVKGYVKILLDALNELTSREIIDAEPIIKDFIAKSGVSESLVATRANAFGNIYQTIKEKVKALSH